MVYIVLYTQAAYNDLVSTFPWRHQKCELLQAQKEERRQFAVNGYIVIYEIDEHNKTVNIIRIVCEKSNLTNMVN